MTDNMSGREYDIVLVGATGYTGALTAEHIAEHLPTKLKWAIAGRSSAKLNVLAKKLRQLAPDRLQPSIECISVGMEHLAYCQYSSRNRGCSGQFSAWYYR